MKRWFVVLGAMIVVLFPVRAVAEYTEARAESRIEARNGETVFNRVVSVATSGGRWEKRQEIRENIRERFQDLMEQWRERLGQIRDTRKKAILERINNRICQVNENRTNIMAQHMDKMSQILDRVETKTNEAKSKGKDVSAVEAAIATARTKIADAKTAISEQSGKVCAIEITGDETKLGPEVREAVKEFKAELLAVHQKIKDARSAVVTAVQKLATVLGVEVPSKFKEGE